MYHRRKLCMNFCARTMRMLGTSFLAGLLAPWRTLAGASRLISHNEPPRYEAAS